MNESFDGEYRRTSVTDPLRQGDVLESTDKNVSMWERHLFVMTADCDFAHAKHHGRVTCIPLLVDVEYLAELQLPRMRERIIRAQVKVLQKILAEPGMPTISDARLRGWPNDEPPSVIVSERLKLVEPESEVAKSALDALLLLSNPATTLKEQFDQLVEAQLRPANHQKRDSIAKGLRSELQQTYSKTPGDALFLSEIAPGHCLGYFAYLRHIEQVAEPEIALRPGRQAVRYRRVSRLNERFTHALVQRFAMVFMAIGLPSDYEDMRDIYAENLGALLS
ncbi:MAG: hypothetical protein ACJ786_38445 [Catenulispora sp.]